MENNKNEPSEEKTLKSMFDNTGSGTHCKQSASSRMNNVNHSTIDEEALMRIMAGEKPGDVNYKPIQTPMERHKKRDVTGSKKRFTKEEYYQEFFKIPLQTASKGKSVYLRPEHHHKFMRLISVLGIERMTIYAYVDNIIEHHFQEFENLISEIFDEKNSPLF